MRLQLVLLRPSGQYGTYTNFHFSFTTITPVVDVCCKKSLWSRRRHTTSSCNCGHCTKITAQSTVVLFLRVSSKQLKFLRLHLVAISGTALAEERQTALMINGKEVSLYNALTREMPFKTKFFQVHPNFL